MRRTRIDFIDRCNIRARMPGQDAEPWMLKRTKCVPQMIRSMKKNGNILISLFWPQPWKLNDFNRFNSFQSSLTRIRT